MKLLIKIWLLLLLVVGTFVIKQERLGTAVFRHRWDRPGEKIMAGDKRTAELKAKADRLGAVRLNLSVYSQEVDGNDTYDSLIFRIKEEGRQQWYYQQRYDNIIHSQEWYAQRDYGFLDHSRVIFPFGFPPIDNSKGKIYQLEIESVAGSDEKAFALKPNFFSFYARGLLPEFVLTKATSLINSLLAVPLVNYLLILFLGVLLARRQKIPRPWLDFLATAWLLLVASVTAFLLFGGSEKLEWGIYVIAGAGMIPLTWILKRVSLTRGQTLFTFSFAALVLWLSLSGNLLNRQLIFLPLALLAPSLSFINLLAIVVVLAYFSVNFSFMPLWQVGLAWIFCFLAPRIKIRYQPPLWLITIVLIPLIIGSVLKPIDYHHYISFAGAAFDVLKGKQLLVDTPSIYGYLSIHFIAAVLKHVGVTLRSFHFLNMGLFAGYFILACLVIFKLVKNRLWALAIAIMWISLPTIFSYHSVSFPPQIGPLRFGLSLLVIAALAYLPVRLAVILGSLFSAVALFWSAETAIYVIPAWLVTLLVFGKRDRLVGLGLLTMVGSLIYLLLRSNGFSFGRFVEFASSIQGGVVALPIPFFGNYYLAVMVLILGVVAIAYHWQPLMVFLTVHNLAIFSYFVSRSHENNIVNLSGFIILELLVIGQNWRIKKLLIVPLTLFLTLFGFRLFSQILKQDIHGWLPAGSDGPVLTVALEQYRLQNRPVALLADDGDTRLLIESGIKNELPLNPAIMNTWLKPGSEYQYLDPATEKLLPGTLVIVAADTDGGFLAPAWQKIQNLYRLNQVGIIPEVNLTIYEIQTPRI